MGLLSEHPRQSAVLRKFLNNKVGGKRYTPLDKINMIALWFTPQLPKSWICAQFETLGMDPAIARKRITWIVKRSDYHKWKHLGQENILHIGQPEVQRYFDRKPKHLRNTHVPIWAIPIFQDHIKQGMTQKAIAEKYGIALSTLKLSIKRSIFAPRRLTYYDIKYGKQQS